MAAQTSDAFAAAFGNIPALTQQQEERAQEVQREVEGKICGAECSLRLQCMAPATVTECHTCYATGCNGKIHHLCAIASSFLDPKNELNVFCSKACMEKSAKSRRK